MHEVEPTERSAWPLTLRKLHR